MARASCVIGAPNRGGALRPRHGRKRHERSPVGEGSRLPDAQHERKWGQLTFTREGDWHHWIAAISPTKTAVKLMLHKGALLADPH